MDDTLDEEDETVVVTMDTPAYATQGAATVHTATLIDDDDPPSVQFTLPSSSAGEDGGPFPVEVSLSALSGKEISVPFSAGGTAVDPDDYSLSDTSFVLPAGTLSLSVDVLPVDDALDEADETVLLTLGAPTNASLGAQAAHTLTLQDADEPPTVAFQVATGDVAEGVGSATITLQLSAVSGQDVIAGGEWALLV